MQIDEKMIEAGEVELARVLKNFDYCMPTDGMARVLRAALECAKPKDAERLKLGSRLTVEGVEAVVVPVDPADEMLDAGCGKWVMLYPAFDGEKPQPTAGDVADTIYRAMLSAAGDKE